MKRAQEDLDRRGLEARIASLSAKLHQLEEENLQLKETVDRLGNWHDLAEQMLRREASVRV